MDLRVAWLRHALLALAVIVHASVTLAGVLYWYRQTEFPAHCLAGEYFLAVPSEWTVGDEYDVQVRTFIPSATVQEVPAPNVTVGVVAAVYLLVLVVVYPVHVLEDARRERDQDRRVETVSGAMFKKVACAPYRYACHGYPNIVAIALLLWTVLAHGLVFGLWAVEPVRFEIPEQQLPGEAGAPNASWPELGQLRLEWDYDALRDAILGNDSDSAARIISASCPLLGSVWSCDLWSQRGMGSGAHYVPWLNEGCEADVDALRARVNATAFLMTLGLVALAGCLFYCVYEPWRSINRWIEYKPDFVSGLDYVHADTAFLARALRAAAAADAAAETPALL